MNVNTLGFTDLGDAPAETTHSEPYASTNVAALQNT